MLMKPNLLGGDATILRQEAHRQGTIPARYKQPASGTAKIDSAKWHTLALHFHEKTNQRHTG